MLELKKCSKAKPLFPDGPGYLSPGNRPCFQPFFLIALSVCFRFDLSVLFSGLFNLSSQKWIRRSTSLTRMDLCQNGATSVRCCAITRYSQNVPLDFTGNKRKQDNVAIKRIRRSCVRRSSIFRAQVHVVCIPRGRGWVCKLSNGHNIPSAAPERFGLWWLQAKRMLSANLCRQAVPPALLHLGNVLLNGPQNCLETAALSYLGY